jgi:hypothetical protein
MSDRLPGKGLFGWLGRQIGYVSKAVRTDPTTAPLNRATTEERGEAAKPSAAEPAGEVLFRQGQVQEAEHPTQPGVKLRRTIIDEVIAEPGDPPGTP